MIIGVPKETKDSEFRVALTPAATEVLTRAGHEVWLENGAGVGCGFPDQEYSRRGVRIVADHGEVFGAPLVVKVKEPQPAEYPLLKHGTTLFCYLHLAPAPELTRALLERDVVGIAFETVELTDGSLPLLTPMSEIAGKTAVQMASYYLAKVNGGSGKLMGGVPGVPPCHVVVLGAGVAGSNAAALALGMGARVTLINRSIDRLRQLAQVLHGNVATMGSTPHAIAQAVEGADVLVGAVLVAGARAPQLVTRDMVATMQPGGVVVDISVDQGGCIETSRPTSHSHPVYTAAGVTHYCVDNMPGIYPQTATLALSNVILPYILQLAGMGL
ncbi:MAG: alanine dehydrogenase, partial [Dehalococcoidia bacterium]|nr:alanine dehydrogenase [Dehalococcoidia bacterium]